MVYLSLFFSVFLALFLALSHFLSNVPLHYSCHTCCAQCCTFSFSHARLFSHYFSSVLFLSSVLCLSHVLSCMRSYSVSCLLILAHSFFCSHPFCLVLSLSLTHMLPFSCSHSLIFSLVHSFSYTLSLVLLHSRCPSHSWALCLSVSLPVSFVLSLHLNFLYLTFLWKICPFCYPASGQGLVIQDSSITRDNTALCIFLTGLVSKIFFPLGVPLFLPHFPPPSFIIAWRQESVGRGERSSFSSPGRHRHHSTNQSTHMLSH